MAVYGDDRTEAAIRTASVLVASSWSASSNERGIDRIDQRRARVRRPDPGEAARVALR